MKLHKALSTGLAFRRTESAGGSWFTDGTHEVWSTSEVLSQEWQVRLPDDTITDSLEEFAAKCAIVHDSVVMKPEASNPVQALKKFGYLSSVVTTDDLRSSVAHGFHAVKTCECGSEAIGGGSHSNWWPKGEE